MKSSIKKRISVILVMMMAFAIVQVGAVTSAYAETSGDAYVHFDSGTSTWTMGTALVEKVIGFNTNNQFLLTSFKNKMTNSEYIQGTQDSDEFSVNIGSTVYNGSTTGWIYDDYSISTLSQGELQLKINFHNSVIKVPPAVSNSFRV